MRTFYEKYLTVVFWPVLLILISWGTYEIVMMPEEFPWGHTNSDNDQDGWENVPFRATKPRLKETSEDGSIRWELWSEKIEGVMGEGGELTSLVVRFTFRDDTILTVQADRGSYDETEKHLEASGNVSGKYPSGEMSFTCNAVDYFERDKSLAITGDVNFIAVREGVMIACAEVMADLSSEFSHIEFLGGVDVDLYKLK